MANALIECKGGLSLAAPGYTVAPGKALLAVNYDLDQFGNYRRLDGYERFDGHPAPSAAPEPTEFTDYDDFVTQWKATQAIRRSAIGPVPGTGPVRGVAVFKGDVYAFRDYDSTNCKMYKATASGWTLVTTPALLKGGSYEFVVDNFIGGATGVRLFGVDGKNKPFMFDGTTFTQLDPGTGSVYPTTICAHALHLFLGYDRGSVLHSKIGDPTDWSAVNGAGEIAVGDTVVGLLSLAGGSMAVLCRGRSYMLYGKTIDSFDLQNVSTKIRAKAKTLQNVIDAMYLDDAGVTGMARTQNFGNFNAATLSSDIKPLVEFYREKTVCSLAVKSRDQYRLFFNDKSGLIATFVGGELAGFTTFQYEVQAACSFAGEDSTGAEMLLIGADNGYVYRIESGRSFDGGQLAYALRLPFANFGSLRGRKRFQRANVHLKAEERSTISFRYTLDYSSFYNFEQDGLSAYETDVALIERGGDFFGSATAIFGKTRFGSKYINDFIVPMTGVGYNISFLLGGQSDFELPHTLQLIGVDFTPRKQDVAYV